MYLYLPDITLLWFLYHLSSWFLLDDFFIKNKCISFVVNKIKYQDHYEYLKICMVLACVFQKCRTRSYKIERNSTKHDTVFNKRARRLGNLKKKTKTTIQFDFHGKHSFLTIFRTRAITIFSYFDSYQIIYNVSESIGNCWTDNFQSITKCITKIFRMNEDIFVLLSCMIYQR